MRILETPIAIDELKSIALETFGEAVRQKIIGITGQWIIR